VAVWSQRERVISFSPYSTPIRYSCEFLSFAGVILVMTSENNHSLIFVYNADSGLFNTLTDIAHKVLSPQTYSCNLCAITHGLFSERDEWRQFLEQLPVSLEFLHRDEYERQYSQIDCMYPVVLERKGDVLDVLISSSEINRCKNVDDLEALIRAIL